MTIDSLHGLLIDELSDLHSAGSQLLKVLPKMAEASVAPELRQIFETQIVEVRAQVERVEIVSRALDVEVSGKRRRSMEGLVEEIEEMIAERAASHARDAGLSLKALRMQHYLRAAGNGASKTYALLAQEVAQSDGQTSDEDEGEDNLIGLANYNTDLEAVH